ncbi:MAG: PocR ligand-binding domain-containing protein [Methanospirillum sp.]|nr:PocR ligand-binding domain-containing protein [Methanospirillum sp.]
MTQLLKNTSPVRSEKRSLLYQVLIFIVLAAGIIIIGYLYYCSYEKEYHSGVEGQLRSVGDLKVQELVRWRNERMGDARLLYVNSAFSSLVREYRDNPDDRNVRSELHVWLYNIQKNYHYSRVCLLHPDGTVIISVPDTSQKLSSVVKKTLPLVTKTGQIEFIDFYRDDQDDEIYLTILVPILDNGDFNDPVGIVSLQIISDEYLCPFISQWPTESESAETLLVRKEGDSVMYLNKLRFRENIALSYSLPLNQTTRPPVMAVLGNEGIVKGTDYRGVPVIAYIRSVPGSPWYLVARIDSAEVFEFLTARTTDLIIIVIILLIATGGGLFILHQKESERYYQEQMVIKEALLKSEALFKGIFNTMTSGGVIYSVQNDGSKGSDYIVTDFNPAGLNIEGISRDEIVGRPITTIRPEIDDFGLILAFQKVWKTGETIYYPPKKYPGGKNDKLYENYLFRLPNGQIVVIYNDVTEKIKTDEEREKLIDQLSQNNEQLNAAYEQLAGSEEELRFQFNALASAEERLRQTTTYLENLINYANVPIIVWDPNFTITRLNHSCESLLGITSYEVLGKSIKTLIPSDKVEYSMRLLKTTSAGVRLDTVEIPIQHKDGSTRSVIWNISTIYDSSGEHPVATIAQGRDITLIKRLELENKASVAQIQKNLAQFSVLNDQIRNPLTLILTYTEIAEDCDVASKISEQVRRIDDIVTHLDLRWVESDKILQMLRKNYNIITSPSIDQTLHKRGGRDEQEIDESDISSEKLLSSARLRIHEIEAELFTILDSIDAYIYVADLKTYEMLYINKHGRSLFGDIAGKKCYQVIEKGQTGPCSFCTNDQLMDESGPTGVYQSENRNSWNGRWYDCRDRVIRWSDGRLVHLRVATDITRQKEVEEELIQSKTELKRKLDAILLPEGDIETLSLSDIIDVTEIQQLMDYFYSLTNIGVGIVDINGNVLVKTGWRDICTKFHRVHPETCKQCIESDTQLSSGVAPGTFKLYRCRNNMWDMATPIMLGGAHLGNLFLGQFFFDDEEIDYSFFSKQARKYGFDEEEYIQALKQVPRWSRESIDAVMQFYTNLVSLISKVSWANIRLARIITERDSLISAIRKKNEDLEITLVKENQLTEELHERDEELRQQVDELSQAKHNWEQIFQSIGSPALILDINNRILNANSIVIEKTGITLDELIGKNCWEIFHGENAVTPVDGCPCVKLLQTKRTETCEIEVSAFGGTYLVTCSPILTIDGSVDRIIHIAMDITEKRNAEKALSELNQKLRLLTSLTRHDIINQVQIIQSLHYLCSETSDLSEIQEYISLASNSTERIQSIIGFTRVYENFGIASSGWQPVHQTITDALSEVTHRMVTVEIDIPGSLEIYADPIIRKVFVTLMENAIRHGEKVTKIRFMSEIKNEDLIISCSDDGIGISAREKEAVFTHGYGKHTGVGLFISREILAITGLSILETGTEGSGARFEILVPARKFRFQKD